MVEPNIAKTALRDAETQAVKNGRPCPLLDEITPVLAAMVFVAWVFLFLAFCIAIGG